MKTRAFFVLLIVALFWIAPKPKSSEAQAEQEIVPVAHVEIEASPIVITPYVKPTPEK